MKVLHVIPAIAPRYGGPSLAVLGMCRALSAAGVEAVVATTDADGQGRLPVALGYVEPYEGVPAIFFRRRWTESYKWAGGLTGWLARNVADFDVVHVHAVFSYSSLAAGRRCRSRGVPYVLRPLGTLDPWSVNRKRLRKVVLWKLGVGAMIAGAAALQYTSREEMRLAESVAGPAPKGFVVPVGIEEALFAERPAQRDAEPYVLALTRLHPKKGLDLLIEAFAAATLAPGAGHWRLIIAGAGEPEYAGRLRAMAAGNSAASRIEFREWVSGQAKTDLLANAGLFAAPSHQENFGISIVEALASGVPAIVTPGVNLAADISAAAAGWVVPRDRASLIRVLGEAMTDARGREARGAAARSWAQRFRWPRIAGSLIKMYDDVLSAHRAPRTLHPAQHPAPGTKHPAPL